jgi:hypothetical protein
MGNGRLGLGFTEKLDWQKIEGTALKTREAEHASEIPCYRQSKAG